MPGKMPCGQRLRLAGMACLVSFLQKLLRFFHRILLTSRHSLIYLVFQSKCSVRLWQWLQHFSLFVSCGPFKWKRSEKLPNFKPRGWANRNSVSFCAVNYFGAWWQPRRRSVSALRGLSGKLSSRNKEAFGTLHKLESLTTDSLRELERLISDLRPSHLDDLGLSATLRWYAGKIQEHSTISIRVDIIGEEHDLDDAMKITIFRVIQESLNNIIKHAQASLVNIYLRFEEKNVRINVRDNGMGFDLDYAKQKCTRRASLGLAGMEERAALLGGTLMVQSRPGYGTEVEALIPYDHIGAEMRYRLQEVKDDHTSISSG